DPEPTLLSALRTADEARAIVAKRLAYLYAEADVDAPAGDDLFPFDEAGLAPLANVRSRDLLNNLRQHHEWCVLHGRWERPDWHQPPIVGPQIDQLTQLWTDF